MGQAVTYLWEAPITRLALLLAPFIFPLLTLSTFNTQVGAQVMEIVLMPAILIPLSPPTVSQITTLEDDSDLPLMVAVGVARAVGVYSDDLVVSQDLVPVPMYEESQVAAGL